MLIYNCGNPVRPIALAFLMSSSKHIYSIVSSDISQSVISCKLGLSVGEINVEKQTNLEEKKTKNSSACIEGSIAFCFVLVKLDVVPLLILQIAPT